jgi:hypothetical protein
MSYEALNELAARYRRRILNYHERRYFAAQDRAVYVNHFRAKIKTFASQLGDCTYKQAIIERFTEGLLVQKDLQEVLEEVERIRVDLKQKNWAVHEYQGALVEPFPISDLVRKEGARPAIHYYLLCKAADFFWKMGEQLLKAQKRGAQAAKEEHAIFERARQGIFKSDKEAPPPVVGFKMEGKGAAMRIEKLYRELLSERFIDSKTRLEQFVAVFNGVPVEQPVIWKKQQTQLIYLLGAMVNYKLLIAPEGIAYGSWLYPRIIASFHSKQGQPFTAKQLTQTLHDIEKKERAPAHRDFLENLIQHIAGMDWRDAVSKDE